MATSDERATQLDELLDQAGAIGNALLVGDHDDAREWTRDLELRAAELGHGQITEAAARLATTLGPVGSGPASRFGPAIDDLSDALHDASVS